MPALILIIFIAVPLAEIAVFIKVGELIGLGATIAVVIITAIIGTALLRAQGLATMIKAQKAISEGRIPVDSVVDGACLLVAGAFLLTPGMITDTIGFLLFIPPLRSLIAKWAFNRLKHSANIHVSASGFPPRSPHPPNDGPTHSQDGPVIDGEFERLDSNDPPANSKPGPSDSNPSQKTGPSPWRR